MAFNNNLDSTYSIWTKHNSFCSKIALNFMNDHPSAEYWDWIQECPWHPKIIFFVWQMWWGRMPTNDNINYTLPIFPKLCTFCPTSTEDMNHILRMCPHANKIGNVLNISTNLSSNFKDWLKENLTSMAISTHAQVPCKVIFVFALWFIWLRRNFI